MSIDISKIRKSHHIYVLWLKSQGFYVSSLMTSMLNVDKCKLYSLLEAIHKRRPQSGSERRFVQCGHFADKERRVLQMRTFAFFGAKKFGFLEILGVSARTRGEEVEPVRTFCEQGRRGVDFSRFCADVFYGQPLIIVQEKINK